MADSETDLHFPKAGIDLALGFAKQQNRPSVNGQYARTTPVAFNVRTFAGDGRSRGGSRPGLVKYNPLQPGGTVWVTQLLTTLTGVGYDPPGGGMPQSSQSGRIVTIVAVSQGNVYVANPGGTSWESPTNNSGETPPLNFSGIMFSSANNQKLYFADGTNWAYYDPHVNTVEAWVATAGTLPEDSDGNAPRLICTWRGRTVVSGLLRDPQNWFMSAVSDPSDWDYSPASLTPTMAVAGNNSELGLIGDVVTALIPYSDDVLIFGGDSTIFLMRGDPAAGGSIDRVTDAIGIAWGQAWCKDPTGTVYFFGSIPGIYTLVPGQQPQRVSLGIEPLLREINTGDNSVRLVWDDPMQGLHVYVTPLAEPGTARHFFYEKRSGAWFVDLFGDDNHNPLTCTTVDGNLPADRTVLIGSWDGYVRAYSPTAPDDDGTPVASGVVIGPLLTNDMDELMLKDIQGVLGETSGAVTWDVLVGRTAEAALDADPAVTGTFLGGRNLTQPVRRAGHACYIRLTSTVAWAMESIRARIAAKGKVRRRGH